MGSNKQGVYTAVRVDGRKQKRNPARRSHRSEKKRDSLPLTLYEKWQMMLTFLVYALVGQWILLLPVILVTLVYSLFHRTISFFAGSVVTLFSKPPNTRWHKKTVLINGCSQATALHLARILHSAGHRVIACDFPLNWFNPTRFSNAVDAYYTVPNPRRGVQEYVRALCLLAEKENVDLFIPVSRVEDMRYDFFTKIPLERQGCRVFLLHPWSKNSVIALGNNNNNNGHCDNNYYDPLADLENSDDSGVHLTRRQSGSSASSGCSTPFEDEEGLLADLSGFTSFLGTMEKFTCTTLVRDGQVFAISTSPNNPNSNMRLTPNIQEHILKWSFEVLKQLGPGLQSGALTFDLVISDEGRVFPINCGPYIGLPFLNLQSQPELAHLLVQKVVNIPDRPVQSVMKPSRFCIYPEILNILRQHSGERFKQFATQFWRSKEAFFDSDDPLPFFTHYHLHMPFIMGFQLMRGKSWTETDHINGKLL